VERLSLEGRIEDRAIGEPSDVVDPDSAGPLRPDAQSFAELLDVETRRGELEVGEVDAEFRRELEFRWVRGWKRTRGRATGACPE
jgi:hypothetical protein